MFLKVRTKRFKFRKPVLSYSLQLGAFSLQPFTVPSIVSVANQAEFLLALHCLLRLVSNHH